MPYSLVRTVDATTEPVTLAEAKAQLRVTATGEDTFIGNLITTVRQLFEERTGRSLINQTWALKLDSFFACDASTRWISLPRGPVSSVSSISYVDAAGDSQTWAATTGYQSDLTSEPPRIMPAYGTNWPITRYQLNAITITYVAGYGSAASNVPLAIKHALLIAIADLFENRSSILTGGGVSNPLKYDLFWLPWKIADDFTNYSGAA